MEIGLSGSLATFNARSVINSESSIVNSDPTRRCDDSTPLTWVDLASDNDHNNDDNDDDDDVLSGVLLQVRHAYIRPPATSAHGKKRQHCNSSSSRTVVVVAGLVSCG